MVTKKELAKRIKELRGEWGLSQEELGERLGLNRSSIAQMELAQREINSVELSRLSELFGISIDELLNSKSDSERKELVIDFGKHFKDIHFNKEKFKQVLIYLLEKCGAKPNVGETVIYKLLYFIEFNFYELYEINLTGEVYRKIQYGPAPCHFPDIVKEMVKMGEIKKVITEYYGMPQKKYIPQIKPNLSKLNGSEIAVIDDVVERLSSMNVMAIEDYSHKDIPYKVAEDKEIIDFETVFYREPSYSVRDYPEDK